MSAARLVLRLVVATVTVLALGLVGVVGFTLLEPFSQAFGSAPASLGWADSNVLIFAGAAFLGLILVVIIWLVAAPIRTDVRQEFGR